MLHSASGQARVGRMPGLQGAKCFPFLKLTQHYQTQMAASDFCAWIAILMRSNSRKDAIIEIYLCWHWWRARLSWAVTNVLCFIINELITSLLHNASTKTIIYDTIWFSWQNLHEIWFFQAPATHDYYPIFRTQSGGSCSVFTGRNCHYGTRAQQGWFQISESSASENLMVL